MTTETNKPVYKEQIGTIHAAIWSNQTESGTRYNVSFERHYKEGDQWKTTNSFGRDDLLTLAKLADRMHTRIYELQAEARS